MKATVQQIEALLKLDEIILASDSTIKKRFMKYDFPEHQAQELVVYMRKIFKEVIAEELTSRLKD